MIEEIKGYLFYNSITNEEEINTLKLCGIEMDKFINFWYSSEQQIFEYQNENMNIEKVME